MSNLRDLLVTQVEDAQKRHPSLHLQEHGGHDYRARGRIGVRGKCHGQEVRGEYDLAIRFPANYPDRPPTAYDYERQIPLVFEHVEVDSRQLCLGAPVEVNRMFSEGRTLRCFLERLVEPYLFQATCAAHFGTSQFPELSHGRTGILEYYVQQFDCHALRAVLLLLLLTKTEIPWDTDCPCRSSKAVKDCHGETLRALRPHQTVAEFTEEFRFLADLVLSSPHYGTVPRGGDLQESETTQR